MWFFAWRLNEWQCAAFCDAGHDYSMVLTAYFGTIMSTQMFSCMERLATPYPLTRTLTLDKLHSSSRATIHPHASLLMFFVFLIRLCGRHPRQPESDSVFDVAIDLNTPSHLLPTICSLQVHFPPALRRMNRGQEQRIRWKSCQLLLF